MNFLSIILSVFLLSSCNNDTTQQGNEKFQMNEPDLVLLNSQANYSPDEIEGSIGIVTLSENFEYGDSLFIYDKVGLIWNVIIITHEYQNIVLKCTNIGEDFYEVLIEDTISHTKFISKKDDGFTFETWVDHITKTAFAIKFDNKNNPLRLEPDLNSETLYFDPNEFFHPIRIDGEWLEVKWGEEDIWNYGWVRWKYEGKLIIELFYFA